MTARERLDSFLERLRQRLRLHIYVRAAAVAAAGVLALTAATVWLLERRGFEPTIAAIGRVLLLFALATVAVLLLWLPLRAFKRAGGARIFETKLPTQRGRIETYLDSKRREEQGQQSPLIELLAEDAGTLAEQTPIEQVVPTRRISIATAIAVGAALTLAVLLIAGPGYWGYGTRHLLLGAEIPRDAVPSRRITVMPGDATVRRNSDLAIRAAIEGFDPDNAEVFVRFADQEEWERAPMRPASERGQWEFKLFALRGPLQYYVAAEGLKSGQHNVGVIDLPRVEKVRLTYNYPEWTGLDPVTDDANRDIRAVAETDVKVEVFADAPLDSPVLILDGTTGALTREGNANAGNIAVKKPGRYQIAARVANEVVPLTDEYTIEVVDDEKPTIEIIKPGRDWRATSIEEVPVRIKAEDDFRLQDVELRYSVNGGQWRALQIDGATKQTNKESLLRMEELGTEQKSAATESAPQLAPGDLVSYYAVAKDRKQTVQTDLFMVQVQPFERRFLQGQGGGGGGGGGGAGDEQGQISERQREILLATWNLQRSSARTDRGEGRTKQQLEDNAKMLSELQATLAQQARTLAQRTRARSSDDDEGVKTFVESLEKAATLMDPAAKHLDNFKLQEAVPVEQQALQQLLRAESAFRDIQVAMQQGGSGGGGQQAARNFAEMFELEMDLKKSQYESESQLSMETSKQEVDDVLRKLKELAERQERLAQEANKSMAMEEQRWRQEQLRREAEDLRRQLAELSREQQQRQQQQSGQQSGSQSGQQSASSQGGQSSSSGSQGNQVAQALESVNRALDQMRAANDQTQRDQQNANKSANEAGRSLRQALDKMDQQTGSGLDQKVEKFADRTQQLADDQRQIESDLHEALANSGQPGQRANARSTLDPKRAEALVQAKQEMADELANLQRDMRTAIQEHRADTPESANRLSEVINEFEGANVAYRLNRSAAEIYYGRAREAAPREGLITEAFENLEQELRELSTQATREAKSSKDEVRPEELLAEVGELRRALEEARRAQREGAQPGQDGRGSGREDQNGRPGEGEGQRPGEEGQRSASNQGSQQGAQQGSQQGGQSGESSSQDGAGGQNGGSTDRGGRVGNGLNAWTPGGRFGGNWDDPIRGGWRVPPAAIGDRISNLANRINTRELSEAELEALRRMARQLRRLSGDPMAAQSDAMMKLIDQIELTALAAAAKSKDAASPHTTTPAQDTPRYREAVAEYYRRLGGS
jgi:hypothetical protein